MNRDVFARKYLTAPKLALVAAICLTAVVALAGYSGSPPLTMRIYAVCCAVGWINFLVHSRIARQRTP